MLVYIQDIFCHNLKRISSFQKNRSNLLLMSQKESEKVYIVKYIVDNEQHIFMYCSERHAHFKYPFKTPAQFIVRSLMER